MEQLVSHNVFYTPQPPSSEQPIVSLLVLAEGLG